MNKTTIPSDELAQIAARNDRPARVTHAAFVDRREARQWPVVTVNYKCGTIGVAFRKADGVLYDAKRNPQLTAVLIAMQDVGSYVIDNGAGYHQAVAQLLISKRLEGLAPVQVV